MWAVAKIKKNQEGIFLSELSKKFQKNFEVYYPRVLITENNKKEKIKNILGNYIFFYQSELNLSKSNSNFNFIKGLQYFIYGSQNDSDQIMNFVDYCKRSENKKGYISNSFFFKMIKTKAQIISGPLKNIILNIVNIDKNKIIANTGKINISINKKSGNYCYPL
ncbi:MAG: hypothetical protein CL687_04815 [Candidatus Pelagibacter sp.]|nr:hypothetical protein [Candidatus Pelagibacter sp.]OUW23357.1 MAG: hypothetical protein CBD34_03210 [Rickettsiales bacterium TMED174]|tara:strand:+ start:700 stop:1191 length:492 start_codon:yes stop_codon:yes gene_type:complete